MRPLKSAAAQPQPVRLLGGWLPEFVRPRGRNVRCARELPATALSEVLCRIASFLQTLAPYTRLERYDDWWEHDGLHFHRGSLGFSKLFAMISSPRALLEAVPGDDQVVVGVGRADGSWYLRFRLEWDDAGANLAGRFDITVPDSVVERFRIDVDR